MIVIHLIARLNFGGTSKYLISLNNDKHLFRSISKSIKYNEYENIYFLTSSRKKGFINLVDFQEDMIDLSKGKYNELLQDYDNHVKSIQSLFFLFFLIY